MEMKGDEIMDDFKTWAEELADRKARRDRLMNLIMFCVVVVAVFLLIFVL